jgi:hypothetical protein
MPTATIRRFQFTACRRSGIPYTMDVDCYAVSESAARAHLDVMLSLHELTFTPRLNGRGPSCTYTAPAPAYRFDAQATADALALLQAASVASSHVASVHRMTYNARTRFDNETRAYFRNDA